MLTTTKQSKLRLRVFEAAVQPVNQAASAEEDLRLMRGYLPEWPVLFVNSLTNSFSSTATRRVFGPSFQRVQRGDNVLCNNQSPAYTESGHDRCSTSCRCFDAIVDGPAAYCTVRPSPNSARSRLRTQRCQ